MKKLLSGLVGACDTSKELVYFTVKAEGW
jgi:hypothetical protein